MNDEKAGLLALINELKFELKEKDKKIAILERKLKAFEKYSDDDWISAEVFTKAIEDAKKAEAQYKKAARELTTLRAQYESQIQKLMEAF